MSTNQIPTLRPTGRRFPRGSPAPPGGMASSSANSADAIVQQTDRDASVSRLSAVEAGYLEDPFAAMFVGAGGRRERRFPIINRGTYLRTRAIDQLVSRFRSALPAVTKQIVSLGAGSDTRFFRLVSQFPAAAGSTSIVYHELDFPALTGPKIATIARSPVLTALVPGPLSLSPTSLHSPTYHIHPIDLRTLDPSSPSHHPDPTTLLPHIEPSLPTLIISECCLVYLTPDAADAVAIYLTRTLFPPSTPLGMILYEPIRPHDAFGQVMLANLAARGIVLPTLRQYGSLAAQRERMARYGFGGGSYGADAMEQEENSPAAPTTGGIGVADVNHLWATGVPDEEKARVAGLEMVDEVEEWELLAGHYCVVWAWRDGEAALAGEDGGDEVSAGPEGGVWEGWRNVVGQDV